MEYKCQTIKKIWSFVVDKGLTYFFEDVSENKLNQLKKQKLPEDYIFFVDQFGVGSVQKKEWPTYIIDFSDKIVLTSDIYRLDKYEKKNIESFRIFGFNLDGSCVL